MRSPRTKDARQSGFALAIALALMAFVVTLVVSLSALIRVEAGRSDAALRALSARQNALLSLRLGLGELQEHSGPDRRVTARAALLNRSARARDMWTGVWRDPNPANNKDPRSTPDAPELLTWLVSGNEGAPPSELVATPETGIDNSTLKPGNIWLVGDARNDRGASEQVQLPRRELAGGDGAYAWWVGDEGVEARINVNRAPPDNAEADAYQLAHRVGTQAIVEQTTGEPLTMLRGRETALARLGAVDDLPFLDPATASLEPRLRDDLTAFSRGILTDTLNGGLKHDLTRAFVDDQAFDDFVDRNGAQIYAGEASSAPAAEDQAQLPGLGGPLWRQLRSYFELHENVPDDGPHATLDLAANEGRCTKPTRKAPFIKNAGARAGPGAFVRGPRGSSG